MAEAASYYRIYAHLVLFLLVLGSAKSYGAKDETLIMVQMLYRHGDRSPTKTFPTNPLPESAWPQGFGQLTQRGMLQHYTLGQFLRDRYIDGHPYKLLNSSYSRYEIKLRSTNYDRTLMSAYANLAGLYPPSDGQVWNQNLSWQPIPVHTVELDTDYLLSTDVDCPKYDELYEKALNGDDVQKEEKENQEFYELLANKTGNPIENLTEAWKVFDPIYSARCNGLTEPDWTNLTWHNVTYFKKLECLNSYQFEVQYNREGEARLRGGPLLGEMIRHMHLKLSNKTTFKAFIYSAHDSTASALLSALKVFNGVAPPYTATVLMELIRIDNDLKVRILYRNDSTQPPYRLTVPGCAVDCPFDEFQRILKSNIPGDWKAECQATEKTFTDVRFLVVIALLCLAVSFGIVLICIVFLRRKKRYNSYNSLLKRDEDSA